MNRYTRSKKRLAGRIFVMVLSLAVFLLAIPVSASTFFSVNLPATKRYTWRNAFLQQVNAARTQANLPTLNYDYATEEYAMLRSAELFLRDEHTRPSLDDGVDILLGMPGTGAAEELLALNIQSQTAVFQSWLADPVEQAKILDPQMTGLSVGVVRVNGPETNNTDVLAWTLLLRGPAVDLGTDFGYTGDVPVSFSIKVDGSEIPGQVALSVEDGTAPFVKIFSASYTGHGDFGPFNVASDSLAWELDSTNGNFSSPGVLVMDSAGDYTVSVHDFSDPNLSVAAASLSYDGTGLGTSTSETAPVETAPVETAPVETAPVETAPVETAPVETAPVETAPVETAPVETALVQTALDETAPVETALVETAPVETAPVQTAPVETAPVETVPVQTAPDETDSEESSASQPSTATESTTVETTAATSSTSEDEEPYDFSNVDFDIAVVGTLDLDWGRIVLDLVNDFRRASDEKLPSISYDMAAQRMADSRAVENIFWKNHSRPNGQVAQMEGLAQGAFRAPEALFRAFLVDPQARQAILDPKVQSMSFSSFALAGNPALRSYVQVFSTEAGIQEPQLPMGRMEVRARLGVPKHFGPLSVVEERLGSQPMRLRFRPALLPADGSPPLYLESAQVRWEVHTPSLGQIDQEGLVTLKKAGDFAVSYRLDDGLGKDSEVYRLSVGEALLERMQLPAATTATPSTVLPTSVLPSTAKKSTAQASTTPAPTTRAVVRTTSPGSKATQLMQRDTNGLGSKLGLGLAAAVGVLLVGTGLYAILMKRGR